MWKSVIDYIPEGQSGNVKIEHFEVTEEASKMSRMRSVFSSDRSEYVKEGKYARLIIDGSVVMSDTDMEKRSNTRVINNAHGNVLIAGLGLGMIILPLLENPEVKSITVIEKNPDVIKLVYPYLKSDKLTVINADIFEWKPDKNSRYDCIYFDIWTNISLDNIDEIKKLHYKFKSKVFVYLILE
jgi:spermidine synthase